jgi:hypothetical protein
MERQIDSLTRQRDDLQQEVSRQDAELRLAAWQNSAPDDSLPWALRPWVQEGEVCRFVGVAGVADWFSLQGYSPIDLGVARFPGYSSADREHLAMTSGMLVSDFLALPFVREGTRRHIQAHLEQGTTPVLQEGEWLIEGEQMRWRVNQMWAHLAQDAPSTFMRPVVWSRYLDGANLALAPALATS